MPLHREYFESTDWLHHHLLGENAELRKLRLAERESPAPFHDDRFWRKHDVGSPMMTIPEPSQRRTPGLGSIPIGQIVGVGAGHASTTHNLPTWGEILFTGVHGGGLAREGVDFLVAQETVKYRAEDGRTTAHGYPQEENLSSIDSLAVSKGGMEFEKRGDVYFCENGQQRVVFARFALWHKYRSLDALLTNVWITGAD